MFHNNKVHCYYKNLHVLFTHYVRQQLCEKVFMPLGGGEGRSPHSPLCRFLGVAIAPIATPLDPPVYTDHNDNWLVLYVISMTTVWSLLT